MEADRVDVRGPVDEKEELLRKILSLSDEEVREVIRRAGV